jgi:hypothetical protein
LASGIGSLELIPWLHNMKDEDEDNLFWIKTNIFVPQLSKGKRITNFFVLKLSKEQRQTKVFVPKLSKERRRNEVFAPQLSKERRRSEVFAPQPVLRIRDVYPGSRILIFTHPGSRISDPGSWIQKQQQKREVKKN